MEVSKYIEVRVGFNHHHLQLNLALNGSLIY